MAIDRGPWEALIDDDGTNLVGSVFGKAEIKTVVLDPVDAAIAAIGGGPHHATHETGGADAIAALDASVITTGLVPAARLGLHHAAHETGGADAITALDASVMTTGVLAAARLPPFDQVVLVPFNASNYGVYPAGTWTVNAGNVVSFAYSRNQQTGFVTVQLSSTVITGTPLLLSVLSPVVATRRTTCSSRTALTSGALELGGVYYEVADSKFYLQRIGANWPAGTLFEVSFTIPMFFA